MHLSSALAGLALLGSASAHTVFSVLYVDGVNQGDGTCIRQSNSFTTSNYPVRPITSAEIACGYNGETAVKHVCPSKAGSTLTFEYRETPNEPDSPSLDPPHMGSCAVYMKKVDDPTVNGTAAGDGWFKIWEEGYDEEKEEWCTDKMIDNDGHLSVNIPTDLQGGYYLVRPELLALHNATASPPDPQFYVGCGQIFVESEGTALPETVNIGENYYTTDIAGLHYDIYATPLDLPYPVAGPAVYQEGSGSTGAVWTEAQTIGVAPVDAIITNANWDGFELESYSDMAGCWNASSACWNQTADCYAQAPPTGSANCKIFEAKCQNINDECTAENFDGPPNKGENLNPALTDLSGSATIFSMDPLAYSTIASNYYTPTAGGVAVTDVPTAQAGSSAEASYATSAAAVAASSDGYSAAASSAYASATQAYSTASAAMAASSAAASVVTAGSYSATGGSDSGASSVDAATAFGSSTAVAIAASSTPAPVYKTVWTIETEYASATDCEMPSGVAPALPSGTAPAPHHHSHAARARRGRHGVYL